MLDEKCPQCGKPLRQVMVNLVPSLPAQDILNANILSKNVAKVNVLMIAANWLNVAGEAVSSGDVQTIQNVSLPYLVTLKKHHVPNVNGHFLAKKVDKQGNVTLFCTDKNCGYKSS